MFQFPGFASSTYEFSAGYSRSCGFPHSDIVGSKLVRSSPTLFAAYHVLRRLSMPRHPPNALNALDFSSSPSCTGIRSRVLANAAMKPIPMGLSLALTRNDHFCVEPSGNQVNMIIPNFEYHQR